MSNFLRNLMANGTITSEQAALLATLSTPHQQFAAITAFRSTRGRSLEVIIEEVRQSPAAKPSTPRNPRVLLWAPRAAALAGVALSLVLWDRHGFLVKNRHPVPSSGEDLKIHGPALPTLPVGKTRLNHPVHAAGTSKPKPAVVKKADRLSRAQSARPPKSPGPVAPIPALKATVLPDPNTSTLAPLPSPAASAPSPAGLAIPSGANLPPPNQERHLSAKGSAHGLLHLTWDAGDAPQQYVLYFASNPEMKDAKPVTGGSIPVNWYDWMPPEDQAPLWLAVQGLLANGIRTGLSHSIQVKSPHSHES